MKSILIIIGLLIFVQFGAGARAENLNPISTICGDADGNGKINLLDVSYIISYLYRGGPKPEPIKSADVDNSDKVNLLDVSYIISYLYRSGPKPVCSIYLGQVPADSTVVIFAPGIVSTSNYEGACTADPAFTEFYYGIGGDIYYVKKVNNVWSDPAIASISTSEYSEYEPFMTPDGQKLIFASSRAPITNFIWCADRTETGWSKPYPLGGVFENLKMMYVTTSLNGNMYFQDLTNMPIDMPIYVSKYVEGVYQTPIRLDNNINATGNQHHPFIAPDESYMIFSDGRSSGYGDWDLYLSFRKADDSWTSPLNLGAYINSSTSEIQPYVSCDGKYFFFTRDNGTTGDIYWCNTSFIDKLRKGIPKIAFYTERYGSTYTGEICTINPDGTGFQRLTANSSIDQCPAFSPDATKIAFMSKRDSKYEIYLMNNDGSDQLRLTFSNEDNYDPEWSPDGSKIVFTRYWTSTFDSSDIFVIDTNGTNETRLTFGPGVNMRPDYYPDGDSILFTSKRDGHYQIYAMNSDGTNQHNISNTETEQYYGQISPDGTKIVYSLMTALPPDPRAEVHLMNSDGTGDIALTENSIVSEDPVWSPDGTEIVFQSNREGAFKLYIMNADGSNVRAIPGTRNYWPSWGAIGAAPSNMK
jgi:Tol biopolymer transport system component